MDIAQALRLFDKKQHPVGGALSESIRVYRGNAEVWCGSSKNRDLFEENALALTSVSNMIQLLPFVLRQETTRIKQAVGGRPISIIFDGTVHV